MKWTASHTLAMALCLCAVETQAQQASDRTEIWTIQDENSSYSRSKPRDHFYTNGLRVGWTSPTGNVPEPLSHLGRTLWGSGQQRIGLDLSQQIYTPLGTQSLNPDPRDRPYAGLLLANLTLLSDTAGTRSILMLSAGVLGPSAGGQEVQNGFHSLFNIPQVHGWSHQIENTPALEVLHEKTWRIPVAARNGLDADILPTLTAGFGDLRDYVQAGATMRIGQGLDSDFGVPRPRPGLSGGDAYTPTRKLAWYVFAGADGQAVAYDLLLQSHPFRSGPHVTPRWDVGEVQGGFAIMAFGIRLTIAYIAQSQEFRGQFGGIHQFGSASLSARF